MSTGAIVADSTTTGVVIGGYSGVLFIEILAATDADDVHQYQVQYSSTGNASDAVTSNAGMSCTDAIFPIHPGATAGEVRLLDFDIGSHGLADRAGALFVSAAAAEGNAESHVCIIGIPYGGTRMYPATNAITVVNANHTFA
jgi:hypothetical protein